MGHASVAAVFSEASLRFLAENREKNSKDWFQQHTSVYEAHLLAPLQELAGRLSEPMLQIDPHLEVTPKVDKTISRIYRDTRFSRDKSLYREQMWLTWMRRQKPKTDYPAFFFEISPNAYRYGMGFFSASVRSMDLYRDWITLHEKAFLKLVRELEQNTVFRPEGALYQKNRYQGSYLELATWYNRKNLYVVVNRASVAELFDFDALLVHLTKGFSRLAPMYAFLCASLLSRYTTTGEGN